MAQYILKEENRRAAIKAPISINGKYIGYITSPTTINVNNRNIDVGEFLAMYNIKDLSSIRVGLMRFSQAYDQNVEQYRMYGNTLGQYGMQRNW